MFTMAREHLPSPTPYPLTHLPPSGQQDGENIPPIVRLTGPWPLNSGFPEE